MLSQILSRHPELRKEAISIASDLLDCDGVLGWAPDFAVEAAAQSVLNLLEMYPRNRRRTVAKRIIAGVEQQAEEWLDMLYRSVDRAIS